MWSTEDNRKVGLEAAILLRERNSSPVYHTLHMGGSGSDRTEDVAGLKQPTEAAAYKKREGECRLLNLIWLFLRNNRLILCFAKQSFSLVFSD